MDLSANVSLGMVYDFMSELGIQFVVGHQLVGEQRSHRDNVFTYQIAQWNRLPIFDYAGANLSATFQYSDHHCLVSLPKFLGAFVLVDVACFGSNESLVNFHLLTSTTEFPAGFGLHSLANAMQHEPCRLLSDADGATEFVGTNTIPAVRQHPHSGKPLVQGNRRILEDGSNLGAELPMMMDTLTLPLPLILEEHNVSASASWTGHSIIRPAEMDHVIQSVVWVAEVLDGLLEGTWVFHSKTTLPEGV